MAKNKTGKVITSVGITAAIAAAAAGAYFLYGTEEGKKHRKHIKGWAVKAKGEVLSQLEKMKEINEDNYHEIIDSVTRRYKNLKDINPGELAAMAKELKGHWQNIQKEFVKSKHTVSKMAKVSREKAKKVRKMIKNGGKTGAKSSKKRSRR